MVEYRHIVMILIMISAGIIQFMLASIILCVEFKKYPKTAKNILYTFSAILGLTTFSAVLFSIYKNN